MEVFTNLKIFSLDDYKELANAFEFKRVSANETIMEYGDEVDNLYILLKGKAVAEINNEAITNWDWLASINNSLVDWKNH